MLGDLDRVARVCQHKPGFFFDTISDAK